MAMTLTELTRRLKHLERRIHRLEEAVRTIEMMEIRAQRLGKV